MLRTFRPLIVTLSVCGLAMLTRVGAQGIEPAIAEPHATISVTGDGEVDVTPDRATLLIAIDSQGATGAAAGADNARTTQAVIRALQAAGVPTPAISTAGYSVEPQWQYPLSKPPQRVGYQASTLLRLSVQSLPKLGPWIDTALSAGASRIDAVRFDSSDMPDATRQALTLAVRHARADADALALAAGGRLGPLEELTMQPEPGTGPVRPLFASARIASPSTRIEAPQLQVNAVVAARWRFLPGQ